MRRKDVLSIVTTDFPTTDKIEETEEVEKEVKDQNVEKETREEKEEADLIEARELSTEKTEVVLVERNYAFLFCLPVE